MLKDIHAAAAVTIISYIPLLGLNFAVYTSRTVLELHALSPFGVYKPLIP